MVKRRWCNVANDCQDCHGSIFQKLHSSARVQFGDAASALRNNIDSFVIAIFLILLSFLLIGAQFFNLSLFSSIYVQAVSCFK